MRVIVWAVVLYRIYANRILDSSGAAAYGPIVSCGDDRTGSDQDCIASGKYRSRSRNPAPCQRMNPPPSDHVLESALPLWKLPYRTPTPEPRFWDTHGPPPTPCSTQTSHGRLEKTYSKRDVAENLHGHCPRQDVV